MGKKRKTQIISDDIIENSEEDITYFEEDAKPVGSRVSLFSFDLPEKSGDKNILLGEKNFESVDAGFKNEDDKQDMQLNGNAKDTSLSSSIDEEDIPNVLLVNYDSLSHSSKKILDNIETKMGFGAVPSIGGETANVKRSYSLRHSTVIKIDKIKNAHIEANVSVSTIVDMAIAHYFDCIFLK